ncbi:hypothetical protein NE237_005609 [Protea cynaroides]|uniref:VQ domain-containing protein n=1 Tax=Protea cynaroides TaxID=273540 RepID=A0A9Q0GLF9_9MAGN|nr:hypothetical protein NE237_005609 [Protea cynaroides]
MDVLSVHQSSKQAKAKKKSKPIKVVYISNPLKVNTTVSNFRALVQELTGRDSSLGGDTGRFSIDDAGDHQTVPVQAMKQVGDDYAREVPQIDAFEIQELPEVEPFDDDIFNFQMLENFEGFLPFFSIC